MTAGAGWEKVTVDIVTLRDVMEEWRLGVTA